MSHYKGLLTETALENITCTEHCSSDLPKIILLDGANGIDSSHVGLDTEDLQPQTGSFLNHLIGMIGVLRRHSVGLPFDIGGDVLIGCQERNSEIHGQMKQKHTFRAMKTDNGPARVKIPVGLTEVTMAST